MPIPTEPLASFVHCAVLRELEPDLGGTARETLEFEADVLAARLARSIERDDVAHEDDLRDEVRLLLRRLGIARPRPTRIALRIGDYVLGFLAARDLCADQKADDQETA